MKVSRRNLWGIGLYLFCGALACTALCSCSFFQSQVTPRHLTKIEAPPPPPAPAECELPYCAVDLDFPLSLITHPKIYVLKEERRLWLIQDNTLVRDFHVALGPNPKGDKYFRGDGRTPEGEYFVCTKNSSSQFYKSLGINYPSPQNAENALSCGMISNNDYCMIKQANDSMRLPPSNTALGGQIFIHGGGCQKDWTLGCIALQNSAIDELFSVVQVGTPVFIMP
ncbi:MAG: L,D-transpeptidase [Syntrophobacteraceae bacterium]